MRKIALILALFALLMVSAAGQTLKDIEKKLDFPGKTVGPEDIGPRKRLLIRNFYSDEQLKYGQGSTALGAHLGSWLGDGYIEIERIDESPDEIKITGKRLPGFLENGSSLRFEQTEDKLILKAPRGHGLEAIFVRPDEDLLSMLPPIWSRFLTGKSPYPHRANVRNPTGGGVRPPRPIQRPAPTWPDYKERKKYEGVVTIACVVDESGKVGDVELVKPLGAGLDEKAAEATAGWRFQPATLKKQPVAVHITIEVDFHLY